MKLAVLLTSASQGQVLCVAALQLLPTHVLELAQKHHLGLLRYQHSLHRRGKVQQVFGAGSHTLSPRL